MCGIAGFLSSAAPGSAESRRRISIMCDAIVHRGPDYGDCWTDEDGRVALGHRRLAILDLSEAGAQPMPSASGRWIIVFNGEIYNHQKLRRELDATAAAPSWRGHSDTETLLAGFDAWGVEATLQRAHGMFAFALWDKSTRQLTLARDRVGEKPLYYGWQGETGADFFLFGSDLAAVKRHPSFAAEIDRNALVDFMRHNCIGGQQSIYRSIYKLPPGCLAKISLDSREPVISCYWSATEVARYGTENPFSGSPDEAINALDSLLGAIVQDQLTADVPVGVFLSGGIDSSIIVALMQSRSPRPVKSFSIGFDDESFDEARHSRAVANYLGTEHSELYVTAAQAMEVIPNLSGIYSEPFADSSQIPTYLVSQLARQQVTVSLSGDGGDELFCGYNRYSATAQVWSKLQHIPRSARQLAARALLSVSPQHWDRLTKFLPHTHVGDKLHKGARLLSSRSAEELYAGLTSQWANPSAVVINGADMGNSDWPQENAFPCFNQVERMMLADLLGYLPNDILTKVDRAAMAASLETRVPFLDHRVIEFAWSLPFNYKFRDGITKWSLRQLLFRYVPQALLARPKMGFAVPIGDWLRGPLRDWAEALLCEHRLRSEGYLNPRPIRQKWTEHLSGRCNWQDHLWSILMFQSWLERSRG